jgi:hypothetical protein
MMGTNRVHPSRDEQRLVIIDDPERDLRQAMSIFLVHQSLEHGHDVVLDSRAFWVDGEEKRREEVSGRGNDKSGVPCRIEKSELSIHLPMR